MVAGDVTADEVKALAEKTYGKVARADTPPRDRPQEPEPQAHRRVALADARVAQPSIQRTYLVPSSRTAEGNEGEALEVLSHVLGGGQTGRLYRTLTVEKGLAAGAGSWYQGTAYDATRFATYATPLPGVTLEQLEAAMDEVIADVAANGVDELELARAKTGLTADMIYAQDNQATLARIYGASWATGLSADEVKAWPDKVKQVTAEEVKAAAQRYLVSSRAVTGYLKPAQAPADPKAGQPAAKRKDDRS